MKLKDFMYIKHTYKHIYMLNSRKIYESIKEPSSREYAIITHDNVMKRHLAITSLEDFKEILKEDVKDLYHSSAYYLFPDKPMDQKEWRGADLIFDIDADHIEKVKLIEIYRCKSCGEVYSKKLNKCVKCGGDLDNIKLIDSRTLGQVKNELKKLYNILTNDLGFSDDKIEIYFSGHRGFHIHVLDENISDLDSIGRLEIKDYITLEGLDITLVTNPDARPFREMINLFLKNSDIFREAFTKEEYRIIKSILSYKEKHQIIIKLRNLKRKMPNFIEKLNKLLIKECSIGIDGIVTVDVSRLIRAPYSIHGKTGLLKSKINYSKIDEEDVIKASIAVDKKVSIYIRYMPKIVWGEFELDETNDERKTVPLTLAIYIANMGLGYDIRDI